MLLGGESFLPIYCMCFNFRHRRTVWIEAETTAGSSASCGETASENRHIYWLALFTSGKKVDRNAYCVWIPSRTDNYSILETHCRLYWYQSKNRQAASNDSKCRTRLRRTHSGRGPHDILLTLSIQTGNAIWLSLHSCSIHVPWRFLVMFELRIEFEA